jgi:hypothetical protein
VTAQAYSQASGLVVYPGDVPTGAVVGLHLTCAKVYCQALSSARQAIVGKGTSRSWTWDLTPLQPGPTSVVITAATYDGVSSTVLNQEIIPVNPKVEKGALVGRARWLVARDHELHDDYGRADHKHRWSCRGNRRGHRMDTAEESQESSGSSRAESPTRH